LCRSAPQCWAAAVAAAVATAAAAAELTHWQKFYYCMLLESDFVGTFYYFSPLLTGPYHRHWLFRRHERGNEQTCNMAQLGTALQGYITSQGWSRWPGRPGCPRRPRESGSGDDHDAQDVRQDEEDRGGHPDHWDNKLTLEARTLHIANRRTTRRTQASSSSTS
jgi:hypothetical protein